MNQHEKTQYSFSVDNHYLSPFQEHLLWPYINVIKKNSNIECKLLLNYLPFWFIYISICVDSELVFYIHDYGLST